MAALHTAGFRNDPVHVQGGAEPTDTFHISILRLRDSLSRLAGGGTVEERTPLHMVRNNGALDVQHRVTCVRSFGDIAWPVRSPELTVPHFSLWGFEKDRVFRKRIMTIPKLKPTIVDEVAAIDEDLRRRGYGNFQTRLQQCNATEANCLM
jgi:hypothetical protein